MSIGVLLGTAACGAGGGGHGSNGMAITVCSLGCTDSGSDPGSQISCNLTDVFLNQEIQVTFTQPIDQASVTSNSFQMTEIPGGKTPPGGFSLKPGDPTVLLYRPQLTFDSAGNPIFGLTQDKSYLLKIPGTIPHDLGPFIRSTTGSENQTRLQCILVASLGVFDANPGRPRATVTVDVVTSYDADGNPATFDFDVVAQDAKDVYRASPVRLVFDDVMNPATLANPVSGDSDFIHAFVDSDGDISDRTDQLPIDGVFTLTIDQVALRTTVVFTPSGGLPSAGTQPGENRKVVIELSPQIADLGGNPLLNPGIISFTVEHIQFPPLVINEPFVESTLEDQVRTGSAWGGGILATGPGGGSGRLGDLIVLPGQVVTLNTDHEDFSGITNLLEFNPGNVIDPPVPLAVDDGVFEFSRLRVDAGGTLRFTGSRPARLYVRGEAIVQGVIDVSGTSGTLHASDTPAGGVGGTPGPNGGAGGSGGSRPDGSNFTGFFNGQPIGGVPNVGVGPSDVLNPATYINVNGKDGGGIPFPSTIAPAPTFVAKGRGGLAWPQPSAANLALHMPANITDVGGLQVEVYQECRYTVPGAPGSGGGNALDGGLGDAVTFGVPSTPITIVPDVPGGDSSELFIDSLVRSLSAELGLLRGGAGGGGGGAHLQRTQINGKFLVNCNSPVPTGSALQVANYIAHSSAGGGGGGGAVQLAAGRRVVLNGVIDASGGDGGSGTFPPDPRAFNDLAQAGGGASGGSVLIQSSIIQIQAIEKRINVSGGDGGIGSGNPFPLQPSTGGNGSPGFLRLEAATAPVIANEQSKVSPLESELVGQYGSSVSIQDVISSDVWNPPVDTPSGWSGAESCWIRPTGNFFKLVFKDDTGGPGWDMRLLIDGQANPQSFRGANDIFPGTTLEQVFGSDFGTAPVVVRFQGARALGTLIDPCSVPETGITTPLAQGSITDWVRHSSELNSFFADPSLTPNIFRFVILWDRSQLDFAGIEGLEDFTVTIQPD